MALKGRSLTGTVKLRIPTIFLPFGSPEKPLTAVVKHAESLKRCLLEEGWPCLRLHAPRDAAGASSWSW
jgi:hypothetical protein